MPALLDRVLYGSGMSPWDLSLSARKATGGATSGIPSGGVHSVVPVGVQGKPQYPDTDTGSLLTTYQRNEIVYAAINRKASAAVGPRLLLKDRKNSGVWEEIQGHPMRRLLMRPNPQMDEAAFLRAYVVSQDVAGRFYAEITRDPNTDLPNGLYPLNPAKIAPIPGPTDVVENYLWRDGNYKVEIPARNILTHSLYNPASQYKPLSPLMVCLGSVDADNAQTDFIRAFFGNSCVPSGILRILNRSISQEQADEIKLKWRLQFTRTFGNQHDLAVLDENAEYQKIGAGLDEIQSEAIRSFTESRVSMVFDVPPLIIYAYVGLLRATYSNLKEAWRGFWDATLTPLFVDYSTWLTWSLLTEFTDPELIYSERIKLDWDKANVPWLQEDVDAVQERARNNFRAGGITLNEYREILGLDADPAGAYYLRPGAMQPQPAGELPTPVAPKAPATNGNGALPAADALAIVASA